MINTLTSRSFLVKANCVASTSWALAGALESPWFFIPAFANLTAAFLALRLKK